MVVYIAELCYLYTIYKLSTMPNLAQINEILSQNPSLGLDFLNTKDFLFLPESESAKKLFPRSLHLVAVLFLPFILVFAVVLLWFLGLNIWVSVSVLIAIGYAALLIFKVVVVALGFTKQFIPVSKEELDALKDEDLPVYTVFVPLYQEAQVAKQVIDALLKLDYPKEKLQIVITLEEYDHETRIALEKQNPPSHIRILTLPDVPPKTKPKALNVAFTEAVGEYVVVYDAEILPDTDQLKKAIVAFKKEENYSCLQVRLDHYNREQNIITKLFNAEFSFYYDLFLPGLERLGAPVPLSGHSTHFRISSLVSIGAWDPYNVTEDCDAAIRSHRLGFKTAVLDSFSQEEATSNLGGWLKQRTRWMKGFLVTTVVHARNPLKFYRDIGGLKNLLVFLFTVPGTVLASLCNFFYWILLVWWMVARPPFIQSLFPPAVFYISLISFLFGNIAFTYLNLVGAYKRDRFHLVKYSLISPVYWFMLSVAALRACWQFVFSPHVWEKTDHGTHLK